MSVIPELKIGKKLGNGHFGEVYLARDSVHGQVAVKILSRATCTDDAQWQAYKHGFLAEAQHLSRARHQNVVRVHYIDEHAATDTIRLCMDYCPGGALHAAYEKAPMDIASVRKAATEATLGLQALHARGMLHRDIKPGNILLDRQNMAQLSDFGLVTDQLIMGYGSQAGYCDHIAYEVWHGSGTSVKTDIWALGMTIFRLLHGKSWYDEAPQPKDRILLGGYADTLRWLPHIPSMWKRFVRKALADDPASRYQNCDQVLSALSRLPVTPIWRVDVSPAMIRWERAAGSRRALVEWQTLSARKHEWRAWTESTTLGRNRNLCGSNSIVGRAEAVKGLEAFFSRY